MKKPNQAAHLGLSELDKLANDTSSPRSEAGSAKFPFIDLEIARMAARDQ